MNCCECGDPIASFKQAWQKVVGWERQRDAGGTNAIALREPQQVFMCTRCMDERKRGVSRGQGRLI